MKKVIFVLFTFVIGITVKSQTVSVENDYLKFSNLQVYKDFADNTTSRATIVSTADGSAGVTTLREANSSLDLPDFIKEIVNTNGIVRIGNILIRFDFANEYLYAVNANSANASTDLTNATPTSTNVFVLDFNTANGIELMEQIESGTLNFANYKDAIENSNSTGRRCPGAGTDKEAYTRRWDERKDFNDCKDASYYVYDEKLVYQRVVIYFSIKAKLQSTWGCGKEPDHGTPPNYTARLKIKATATFNPRCNGDQTLRVDEEIINDKQVWNPYESWRSLRSYFVDVQYSIMHNDPNLIYHDCFPLHIQWPQ